MTLKNILSEIIFYLNMMFYSMILLTSSQVNILR